MTLDDEHMSIQYKIISICMFKSFPNKIFEILKPGTLQQTFNLYCDFEAELLISIKFPQERFFENFVKNFLLVS